MELGKGGLAKTQGFRQRPFTKKKFRQRNFTKTI